jgi:hypothetical protein
MSENVDVEKPCPLKDWTLFAKVKVDKTRYPDSSTYPIKKVKISICDQKDGTGTTRFAYARMGMSGEAKVERLLDGKTRKTVWLLAECEEEPWKLPAPVEVSLKSGDQTTVELTLVADGGGLVVQMTRHDGLPLKKQLPFQLLGPTAGDNKDAQVTVGGRKAFKGLPPGRWKVKIDAAAVLQDQILQTLSPASTGEVEVEIAEGKTETVSFMVSPYTKTQFVAFEVLPEFERGPAPDFDQLGYLSDPDNWDDLARRALLMKSAMRKAETLADKSPEVLKIFMAPEFYWRGKDGGYELASIDSAVEIPTIMAAMREEAKDPKYKNWLFVFGTGIGYMKHGETGKELTFGLLVNGRGTWKNSGGRGSFLKVVADPALDRKTAPEVAVVTRIPHNAADVVRWTAQQSGVSAGVIKWEKISDVEYRILLDKEVAFTKAPFVLKEPATAEIFNVAFVQHGGPAIPGLREAVVYKEFISPIDFLGGNPKTFHAAGGAGRKGRVGGPDSVFMLPTEGSRDKLASAPDWDRSEVSKTGLGGGSIFTMDGITFGLEVCLDHAENRLHRHYMKKTQGEPRVQVHLIPSWGMDIDGGAVVGVDNALVFNVDKNVGVAGALDGAGEYKCPDHPAVRATAPGLCPQDDYFICKSHDQFQNAGPDCTWCTKPAKRVDHKYCSTPHLLDAAVLACPLCATPTKPGFRCPACTMDSLVAGNCTCVAAPPRAPLRFCPEMHPVGDPALVICPGAGCGAPLQVHTEYRCKRHPQLSTTGGPCPTCGKPMVAGRNPLKQAWTPIASAGPGVAVPDLTEKITLRKSPGEAESATNTKTLATKQHEIFEGQSNVVLFPVQDLPAAKVV